MEKMISSLDFIRMSQISHTQILVSGNTPEGFKALYWESFVGGENNFHLHLNGERVFSTMNLWKAIVKFNGQIVNSEQEG